MPRSILRLPVLVMGLTNIPFGAYGAVALIKSEVTVANQPSPLKGVSQLLMLWTALYPPAV